MKKIIICGAAALLLLGSEVVSWGALAAMGLGWLMKAAAEGGFFD